MKIKEQIKEVENMFSDGSGFGDPDARKNAELRLQTLLSKQQMNTANQLNLITWILAIATVLNVILVAIQVIKNC
ncbi:MAG TPA: hypothetical protein PKC40_02590 [Saprospiraceae bacterium]|nr:hypothetical protein [Saprospiraceae bacterium]